MASLGALLAAYRPGTAQVPTVEWPARRVLRPKRRCPQCGVRARKPLVLTVRWKTITDPVRRTELLRCDDCMVRFFENQTPPDYTEPSLMQRGRVPFYLQQGAGLSLITRPIARVNAPPGSSYLDVGCGFGFGLDFAVTARGWVGRGIDPAPLAALGSRVLGLDIQTRYLEPADAACSPSDVVMSSETVEHVVAPRVFVRTLRWALKPGGVLVLTTPDGDGIDPALESATLIPLLSPGLHLVFQNRVSLEAMLRQAGFQHVHIETDGLSLIAFASDLPLSLADDPAVLRARYREYLEERARTSVPGSDLFFGMAGRALTEAVSDGNMAAASRAWGLLAPSVADRFGFDMDRDPLPPPDAMGLPLERLADIVPLNLAGVLYARAMLRMSQGAARADVEAQFDAAARCANTLRASLNSIAIDDMQTADLAWVSRAEAVLCAADRGAPDIVARVAALPEGAPGARAIIAARAFTHLVNRASHGLANALAAAERLRDSDWAAGHDLHHSGPKRDAAFTLGVLELQPGGNAALARTQLHRVRMAVQADGPDWAAASLFWAAFGAELQAMENLGDVEGADRLRREIGARPGVMQAA